jgi:hypothetical protein
MVCGFRGWGQTVAADLIQRILDPLEFISHERLDIKEMVENTLITSRGSSGLLEDVERLFHGDFGLHWKGIHEMPIRTRAQKRTLAHAPQLPNANARARAAQRARGPQREKFAFDGNPRA